MAVYKCKMCGGTIEFNQGDTVGVCDSCGTKQTLPTADDEVIANLHNRATTLRLKCEFDKAEEIYNKILVSNPNDAEAHWGIILCKYGIEYVEDPKTYKRVPTCHRTSFEAILADEDYKSAIANGDVAQRELYEAEAKEIDRIQKDILAIVKNEKPFDVFICYKETDENGKRTQDSVIANDIYYQLTQEGFKVFYAAITLEDKLGKEYEPYIFAALNSAKVMLVVGTRPDFFDAVWVRNEWSRFLKLMKTDREKLLIPCYKDMDAYELPEEFAHLQAQDMSKIGFINDLVRGIKKVITKQEKTVVSTSDYQGNENKNATPFLERVFLFLEDGKWQDANIYCEKVLDIDPKNAEAYLGKLMVELQVRNCKKLADCAEPFDDRDNYSKVLRFGDEALEKEMRGYITHINDRNENTRLSGIYNGAVSTMKAANTEEAYKKAAETFKSISGFKDANALAEQCLDKAEICRKEAERKAEERCIAVEKAAKKRKKIIAITTPIVCACIAFVIVLTTVIIPKQKLNQAMSLLDSGDYDSAYALLEEIGKSDAIASSKYDRAIALIDSGDYEPAYMLLNGLDYKDSNEKLDSIKTQYSQIVLEKALEKANVGDTVCFGAYEQDNNTSNGKEDIEWIVLSKEDNKILVISKYALDCQQYNTSYTDVTWESCSLRKWMNNTFINEAFGLQHQEMILDTNVSADKNPKYSTNPGNATTDKVFLLSITEAEKYFTTDESRKCAPTAYAKAQGAYTSDSYKTASGEAACWWWLRSPGNGQDYAAFVCRDGSVYYYGDRFYNGDDCVRPALWINLE